MALRKSTRSNKAAPAPVAPDDLAYMIGAVAQDGRNLDVSPSCEVVAITALLVAVVVAWARSPLTRLKSAPAGIPALAIGEHLKRTSAYFLRIMVPLCAAWVAGVVLFVTGIPRCSGTP
jgi:hypothetical protein